MADVPRFGDKTRIVLLEYWVVDDVLNDSLADVIAPKSEVGVVWVFVGHAQNRRQVEAESIDVHLFDPIFQVIEDELPKRFVIRAHLIADARLIEIAMVRFFVELGQMVICPIVETTERINRRRRLVVEIRLRTIIKRRLDFATPKSTFSRMVIDDV